ncbi:hypothetical protein H5P28_04330 [Ruficoccus amylovorans]|uniref:Esterase n=1 Tax=Ruficoccus amylovorans TaxID=1804625 RepID=A0A842HAN9_9BACT|nr:alpha/beta hydrolase-fold protein [Ruficoccus amylovorans]MBC2593482.1 hypothetical protein [Ruficoccus amylovorans]
MTIPSFNLSVSIAAILLLLGLSSAHAAASGTSDLKIKKLEPRIWQCDFASTALSRSGRFIVILPEDTLTPADTSSQEFPVIYFLHGRGRNERSLLESPATKSRLLDSPCAIVLPRGDDGWYINSPVRSADRYADYMDEVITLAEEEFHVSSDARHRAIGGWSMGGYGAAMTVTRLPDDFCALATIIGLLDFPRLPIPDKTQNYRVPEDRFGSDPTVWNKLNPRLHVERVKDVALMTVIGEMAFDRQMNEAYIQASTAAGNPPQVVRLPGGHIFKTVEQGVPPAFDFLEAQATR